MKIKYYETKLSWKAAVEQAKAEGHRFLGLTWNAACFDDLIIARLFD